MVSDFIGPLCTLKNCPSKNLSWKIWKTAIFGLEYEKRPFLSIFLHFPYDIMMYEFYVYHISLYHSIIHQSYHLLRLLSITDGYQPLKAALAGGRNVCLYICWKYSNGKSQSIHQSIYWSINKSSINRLANEKINQSINQSIN